MALLSLVVALFGTLILAGASGKQQQRGHVVVHKQMAMDDRVGVLVVGRNFTVTYHVMNMGLSPAYDVKVRPRSDV